MDRRDRPMDRNDPWTDFFIPGAETGLGGREGGFGYPDPRGGGRGR